MYSVKLWGGFKWQKWQHNSNKKSKAVYTILLKAVKYNSDTQDEGKIPFPFTGSCLISSGLTSVKVVTTDGKCEDNCL